MEVVQNENENPTFFRCLVGAYIGSGERLRFHGDGYGRYRYVHEPKGRDLLRYAIFEDLEVL
jgi:hypothetical protein